MKEIRDLFVAEKGASLFDSLCELGKRPDLLFEKMPEDMSEKMRKPYHEAMGFNHCVMLSPIGMDLALAFAMWHSTTQEAHRLSGRERKSADDEDGFPLIFRPAALREWIAARPCQDEHFPNSIR